MPEVNSEQPAHDIEQSEIDRAGGRNDSRIRERAHQIWETEGRPEGREQDHWNQAQREIEGDDVTNMDALREAAREHTDAFIVAADLEDADQREATPGVREQP